MRSLFVLMLLAACELKPPPPKAQPSAGSAPGSAAMAAKAPVAPMPQPVPAPAPVPAPVAVPAPVVVNAGSGSAVPIPPPAISEACSNVAVHFTDILITNADPTQRAFMEQERGKLIQRTALSCARNNWNGDKIKCYTAATKYADLDACNKLP